MSLLVQPVHHHEQHTCYEDSDIQRAVNEKQTVDGLFSQLPHLCILRKTDEFEGESADHTPQSAGRFHGKCADGKDDPFRSSPGFQLMVIGDVYKLGIHDDGNNREDHVSEE